MAYRIDPRVPVDAALRRAAQEQIDKAVRDLSGGEEERHEGVHEARKRFKKLRKAKVTLKTATKVGGVTTRTSRVLKLKR